MAKTKLSIISTKEEPPKRGIHKKSQNKSEKRQRKQTRYKGGGK